MEAKHEQLACRIIEEQGSLHAIVVLDFIGKNISLYVEMINMFCYHTLQKILWQRRWITCTKTKVMFWFPWNIYMANVGIIFQE